MVRAKALDLNEDVISCLDGYGVLGVWIYNASSRNLCFWGKIKDILMLSQEEIEGGLPLTLFLARMHPEDRVRIENSLHEAGSRIETRFRTINPRRPAHQVVLFGRIEHDFSGNVIGSQGIALDVTDIEIGNDARSSQRTVNRMAEQIIALREMADFLQKPRATALIDALMREIGSELAGYLRPQDMRRSH